MCKELKLILKNKIHYYLVATFFFHTFVPTIVVHTNENRRYYKKRNYARSPEDSYQSNDNSQSKLVIKQQKRLSRMIYLYSNLMYFAFLEGKKENRQT